MGNEEVVVEEEKVAVEGKKKGKGSTKSRSGGNKSETLIVEIDTNPEDIVQCVEEGGEVVFDEEQLPIFSEEELEAFPYKIVKLYEAAKNRRAAKSKSEGRMEVLGILGGNATNRLKLRKRRGWHQTWKRPDEYDEAKNNGYIEIRKMKNGDKPGKESGDVLKLVTDGKATLIAMEISQERYDNHLRAVERLSHRAYKANKEGVVSEVEKVNSRIGSRNDRIKVIDDEGDI